jgi:subtilisin family serine protease
MNRFTVSHISVRAIFITLSIFIFSASIFAQHRELYLSNGEHVRVDNPKGGSYSVVTKDGKIQSIHKDDPEEVVHIIVTFKDPPLAAYKDKSLLQKTSLSSVYASLQERHESFRTELNTVRQQLSAQLKSDYSYKITRDYYRALNGVALECKRGMVGRIKALPMVKNVSPDREVKVDLKESVHQIRADIVQDSLGYKGKGVLVGEIDTGIDYDDPALGGGFGPGFRVTGGYDFANSDNDPMDDHGHGTHVAGIIGANGGDTLLGVAPEVKFLAVKVLDANGIGFISGVIAGIEYCLDTDNNPASDDAVDIINMSLGSTAIPDDPLEDAVDNATKAGVLSVVAAGNEGRLGYGTVSSPGTSETALTVGACDSADNVAVFSSIGPDPIHFSIKPEVIAPGVNILSTVLNNETANYSGTSMATPHVTGIAALLKQEHPAWTPEELKAAIVNSAHSLADTVSPFLKGNGRVDALDAATLGTVVKPGVLTFGMTNVESDVWVKKLNLKVKNFRSFSQNVYLNILEGLPSGATLTFDKPSFSLAPLQEVTVAVTLSVPSSVPILAAEPYAYLGKISVVSDSDNVIVPFSFIKSTTLIVTFSTAPAKNFLIANFKTGYYKRIPAGIGQTKYIIPIPPEDTIDIIALMQPMDDFYFVDHKVAIPVGLTYASVSHKEATISISDSMIYDIHNETVNLGTVEVAVQLQFEVTNAFDRPGYSYQIYWFGITPNTGRLFFSPLDSLFFVTKRTAFSRGTEIFILQKNNYGIKNRQDVLFPSGPDNLFDFNFTCAYHNPIMVNTSGYVKKTYMNFEIFNSPGPGSIRVVGRSFDFPFSSGKIYFNKVERNFKNNPYLHLSTYIGASYDTLLSPTVSRPVVTLRTPEFTINDNNEVVFENYYYSLIPSEEPLRRSPRQGIFKEFTVEVLKQGDTINIEDNVHINFPNFTTYIEGDSLYLTKHHNVVFHDLDYQTRPGDGGTMYSNGLSEEADFFSPYWNLPRFKVQAFAHNRSQVNIKSWGTAQLIWIDYPYAYNVYNNVKENSGVYRLMSETYPYKLLGQSGQCMVDFEYQMPDPANWPPYSQNFFPLSISNRVLFPSFSLIQVAMDGRATNIVNPDQNGKIRLVLFDPNSSITSAKLSLVLAPGDEIELPLSYVGGHEYETTIPNYIPIGFIDIVARAEDTKGNKCELNASPGFYFGNAMDSIKLDARLRMISYALNNVEAINMQAGDTLNYTLSYTNHGSDIARNVLVTFPTTPYFRPVGAQLWTIDSLGINDTVHIPINLVYLGKQQSAEEHTYYSPSITWTSGGTTYLRKHNVLIDFQNTITGVAQTASSIPNRFELYQNYPNPFNPSTTIRYDLPKQSRLKIVVYDILGREVATLVNEEKRAGSYTINFNASELASGVYFYQLQTGEYSATKKLLLLK